MNDLKDSVNGCIINAEMLNIEKKKALDKLEANINNCPIEWLSQTNKFVDHIKANIASRDNLIAELRLMVHDYFYKDKDISIDKVNDVVARLQEIDRKDIIAADFYNSVMDEMN